jgi:hypothetical protein
MHRGSEILELLKDVRVWITAGKPANEEKRLVRQLDDLIYDLGHPKHIKAAEQGVAAQAVFANVLEKADPKK